MSAILNDRTETTKRVKLDPELRIVTKEEKERNESEYPRLSYAVDKLAEGWIVVKKKKKGENEESWGFP